MHRPVVFFLLLAGCSQDADCQWGVDELLQHNGLPVEDREDCGGTSYSDQTKVDQGLTCLTNARSSGTPAELTVNFCVDCSIPSTFVVTSAGDLFRVEMEADHYGDDRRTATVERCADIIRDSGGLPVCTQPTRLYRCQDARE